MLVGYARVSTDDQQLDLQTDALTQAGCERIFTDEMSGAKTERPGLTDALSFVRSGDTLVVWRLVIHVGQAGVGMRRQSYDGAVSAQAGGVVLEERPESSEEGRPGPSHLPIMVQVRP